MALHLYYDTLDKDAIYQSLMFIGKGSGSKPCFSRISHAIVNVYVKQVKRGRTI
jgi:hypothetical protein